MDPRNWESLLINSLVHPVSSRILSIVIVVKLKLSSGLYFNKAADSCDYTQNVLCNKKAAKTTAKPTTTSTASTTTASTSRVPPKITSATSRTTFSTTAAPEYEEVSALAKSTRRFNFKDHVIPVPAPKLKKKHL